MIVRNILEFSYSSMSFHECDAKIYYHTTSIILSELHFVGMPGRKMRFVGSKKFCRALFTGSSFCSELLIHFPCVIVEIQPMIFHRKLVRRIKFDFPHRIFRFSVFFFYALIFSSIVVILHFTF